MYKLLKNSLGVTDSSYTNTQAEFSLEVGRVVSHWGRVVLGRVVGGPSCLPTNINIHRQKLETGNTTPNLRRLTV